MECFQAEMWNDFQPSQNFVEILQITCQQRGVPAPPELTFQDLQRVRSRLQDFSQQWQRLAVGETVEVKFVDVMTQ